MYLTARMFIPLPFPADGWEMDHVVVATRHGENKILGVFRNRDEAEATLEEEEEEEEEEDESPKLSEALALVRFGEFIIIDPHLNAISQDLIGLHIPGNVDWSNPSSTLIHRAILTFGLAPEDPPLG